MASDGRRRFLVAVGVGSYDSPEWEELEYVPDELSSVVRYLTSRPFQLTRILEKESLKPKGEEFLLALTKWVTSAERSPEDLLILYWTGHGDADDGRLNLILPTTRDVLADALPFERVVGVLVRNEARIGPVLLLLDVCFAGQAALDIGARLGDFTRKRPRSSPPDIVALRATGSRDEAEQKVFSDALIEGIEKTIDSNERLRPGLDIVRIGARVKDLLAQTGQRPGLWWSGSASNFPFIPNPHHIAHWPDSIDEATQRLFAKLEPASRGVAHPEDTGWFFKGRHKALTDICAWLNSRTAPGLCRITGKVGSGKSAVLGRLYLLSRADYREHIASETLTEDETPSLGSIDAVVLLSGKTFSEIVAEIARGLRVVAETQEQLVAKLKQLDRPPVLLVDGLDEAVAPVKTRDLLDELAEKAVRVIVGIRRPGLESKLQAALEIDLDIPPWIDQAAVEAYVLQRLEDENERLRALSPPWLDDFGGLARAVAHRSEANFLVARLTVTALIAGAPGDPRSADWSYPEDVPNSFKRIFDTLGDDETRIRHLLVPLCYAQGDGLPRGQLWASIASRLSLSNVTDGCFVRLFEKAAYFVVGSFRGAVAFYGLFHAALREYLDRRGVSIEETHHQISEELRRCLDRSDTSEDVGYARAYLTRHLRLACAHQAIADLVADPGWIARQSGGHALDPGNYARDIDEAWSAAHETNLKVTDDVGFVPALAPTVWSLLWRSALVSQVRDLPPSAWALAVRIGAVSPARALRSAVSVGDADTRAIRLTALASLFQGPALDELLDFSSGAVPLPYEKKSSGDAALAQYESVLIAALKGSEAKRLVGRCLRDAPRIKEYGRWLLLKALLPHVGSEQLGQVRALIGEVADESRADWEQATTFGAYVAESVRRGDTASLQEAMSLPRDQLAWWAAAGALFSLRKEGIEFDESLSLFDEMKRADEEIEDWLFRLEVMTVLASAVPDLEIPQHRKALAIYLRQLHGCDTRNARVRSAAAVGGCLPQPHGKRLLLWAKTHFDRPIQHDDLNMVWSHTPRALALAFAESGELALALDVMKHTRDHTYFWPKAVVDVFASFKPQRGNADASGVIARFIEAHPRFELDIFSAFYDWLDDEQKNRVRELLGARRLTMGRDLPSLRCHVAAALAKHEVQTDEEFREFIRLAAGLVPEERSSVVQEMAEASARSGFLGRVSAALEIVDGDWRSMVWGNVLGATAEPFLSKLVENEASRFSFDGAIGPARDEFIRAIATISPQAVKSLSGVPAYLVDRELLVASDVRAFELEYRGGEGAPLRSEHSFLLLLASRRLAPEVRKSFIERLRTELGPWEPASLEDVLASLLAPSSTRFEFEIEPLIGVLASVRSLWFLDLLPESMRKVAVDAFFDSRVRNEYFGHGFLDHNEWLIPALDLEQVMELYRKGREARDDYIRDETVVMLLPRVAELAGYLRAKELGATIRRYGFRLEAMVALWRYMPEDERSSVFAKITAERVGEPDDEISALTKIAPELASWQLQQASEWVVNHFSGKRASLIEPFISAACRLPVQESYAVWDRVISADALRPRDDSAPYLRELVPLAERLGGADALSHIAQNLARAAELWP